MYIGILSMQRVCNYGSVLQAYGLKKMLENRGHDIFFLDIKEGMKEGNILAVNHSEGYGKYFNRYFFRRLIFKYRQKKSEAAFDKYLADLLSVGREKVYDRKCDAVLIGSDEVFNFNKANPWGISMQLFGQIDCADKVASYAASCGYSGVSDVPEACRKELSAALGRLQAISVRDENTAKFVQAFVNQKAVIHLDPVLMYDFSKEVSAAESTLSIANQYMLVYAYRNRISSAEEIEEITKYAKSHRLKIISIGAFQYWADDFLLLSPFEALAYFKNAECVVTDTFHGAIMGAKYHRRLAILVRDSNRNKLGDLIKRVSIQSREVEDIRNLKAVLDRNHHYLEFDAIISSYKEKTQAYFDELGF